MSTASLTFDDVDRLTGGRLGEHAARAPEITVFTKSGGPLTKRISLAADGTLTSDGSACVMTRGQAQRASIANAAALAELIDTLTSAQAIALGTLRPDLPDQVQVVTKAKLNGAGPPPAIARTADNIVYRAGQPAWALADHDTKGMPANVEVALKQHGSYWRALCVVVPALRTVAHVTRRSTSAGLFCATTGAELPGSRGLHVYIAIKDGADIERFLKVLHERCWLAGLGWLMVGAGGQLLERSIVDRVVGAPERLVFEGPPVLIPPLEQHAEKRRPVATDGEALDTLAACPPLTIAEKAKLRELQAKQAHRLAPDSAKARTAFITKQAKRLAERTGKSEQDARKVIERQCEGVLRPDVVLPFDDQDLAGCTVADVLADPERFEGATLADPLEGIEYGTCKAKIMRRVDGTPWIHSFAHGRTVYELKLDADAVRAAMARAADADVVKTFVRLAVAADLDDAEVEELRDAAATRSGITRRSIANMLKAARTKRAGERAQEERNRRLAERNDPRPQIGVPANNAPWLPQMHTLNEVHAGAIQQPRRDIDGTVARAHTMPVPTTHAFISTEANNEEQDS